MKTMNSQSKNNYCTFYIVRHGETEWNVKGILQGQKDSPLTKQGIEQAKETGKALKKIKFDQIYSSDLLRAKRTAEIIVLEKKLAVQTSKLLRERMFGRFEGKKVTQMRRILKKQLAIRESLSNEMHFKYRLEPDFETEAESMARFLTFLRQTALVNFNKQILLVTHGGIMRILLVHLGFASDKELPWGCVSNSGYVIIKSDGTEFFIKQTKGINKLL